MLFLPKRKRVDDRVEGRIRLGGRSDNTGRRRLDGTRGAKAPTENDRRGKGTVKCFYDLS
jgi:hypothetical protein